jgi:hypothetical protein
MKARCVFLLLLLLSAFSCFADLLLLGETRGSLDMDHQDKPIPEVGASLSWDTYSFLSQNYSLFFDTLGILFINPLTGDLDGEADLSTDFSYRSENFLVRIGAQSTFTGVTNEEPYLDLVPELYLAYGTADFTVFTSHKVSFLPLEGKSEFYEARLGTAFSLDTLLNKPIIGVGMDLENGNLPLYAIAEYELSWYPDPLFSLEFTGGIYWYLTGDDYRRYLAQVETLWYLSDTLILSVKMSAEIISSEFFSEPQVKLEPMVELGISLTGKSLLSLDFEGTIYTPKSYLDEPTLLRLAVKYSYLF